MQRLLGIEVQRWDESEKKLQQLGISQKLFHAEKDLGGLVIKGSHVY